MTDVGVARARDLSNRRPLSLDTVKRMVSFFTRHERNSEAEGFREGEKNYPSAGLIAHLGWGGDEGYDWAKRILSKKIGQEELVKMQKRASEEKTIVAKIEKSDDKKKIIYGVVLEPDVLDTDSDFISKEDIQACCHAFMFTNQQIGLQHKFKAPAQIIESYITPVEFFMNKRYIPVGAWVVAIKILDDDLWEAVEDGSLNGFSIGGYAKKTNIKDLDGETLFGEIKDHYLEMSSPSAASVHDGGSIGQSNENFY
jgi:hypothetical protein